MKREMKRENIRYKEVSLPPLCLNGFSLHEPKFLVNNRGQGVRYHFRQTGIFPILLISLISFFSSCTQPLTEKKLAEYVADTGHGLSHTQTINGVDIKVTYRPQDFLVKQSFDAALVKSDSLLMELQTSYNRHLYFVLSLSKNNQEVLSGVAGNRAVFSEMVNRLAFGMGEYVLLTTSNKDTLELVDFVYPRMYGISNSTDILLAFKNENTENAEWLKFSLADVGLQTGNIHYTFKTKDIRKIPKLKFR